MNKKPFYIRIFQLFLHLPGIVFRQTYALRIRAGHKNKGPLSNFFFILAGIVGVLNLAGCISLLPESSDSPPSYLALEASEEEKTHPIKSVDLALVLSVSSQNSLLDSDKITVTYKNKDGLSVKSYLQDYRWVEVLPDHLQRRLLTTFLKVGTFKKVSVPAYGAQSDIMLVLTPDVFEVRFENEALENAQITIKLIGTLLKIPERKIIASRIFERIEPLSSFSQKEAKVRLLKGSFDKAWKNLQKDIIEWSTETLSPKG